MFEQTTTTRFDMALLVKGPTQVWVPPFRIVRLVTESVVSQLENYSVALLITIELSQGVELVRYT